MPRTTRSVRDPHESKARRNLRYGWMRAMLHYPWTLFVTLTFPEDKVKCRPAFAHLDHWLALDGRNLRDVSGTRRLFMSWIRRLARRALSRKKRRQLVHVWFRWAADQLLGSPANWCGAFEQTRDGRLHFHGALGCFDRGDASLLQRSWVALTGGFAVAAKIMPFKERLRVRCISYITKLTPNRSEALWGGPAFPSSSPGHRHEEWQLLGGGRFLLRLPVTDEERAFLTTMFAFLARAGRGLTDPDRFGRLLAHASHRALRQRRPLRDLVSGYFARCLLDAGVECSVVRPRIIASCCMPPPIEVCFKTIRGGVTAWPCANWAILAAKRLQEGMPTIRAIEWLLLDMFVGSVNLGTRIVAGEPAWRFLVRNLARLLGGSPLARRASPDQIVFDPDGVVQSGRLRRGLRVWGVP